MISTDFWVKSFIILVKWWNITRLLVITNGIAVEETYF